MEEEEETRVDGESRGATTMVTIARWWCKSATITQRCDNGGYWSIWDKGGRWRAKEKWRRGGGGGEKDKVELEVTSVTMMTTMEALQGEDRRRRRRKTKGKRRERGGGGRRWSNHNFLPTNFIKVITDKNLSTNTYRRTCNIW